ncbi:replication-relaxation family protein [Brevibacillus reuszeri]|uniref:replication-relaxation family protein n=1 Tax=Brevibacillus reuszeri TaxID=54915 RepID=UPI0013DF62CB|nr:replication-relaxation family protein [Brevibacillus reuszeri]
MAEQVKRKATEDLDNDILVALYDHRHLTLPQICVYCGYDVENKYRLKFNRRLQILIAKNLVRRRRLPQIGMVGNPIYVYYLTENGVGHAVATLGIPYNRYGPDNKIIEKNHFDAKELMVSDRLLPHHYHTQNWIIEFIRQIRSVYGNEMLTTLGLSFKEPKRMPHYVNQIGHVTHRPDWIISVGHSNLTINLEMDMGTENTRKITSKFHNYAEWFRDNPQSGKHVILFASHTEKNITRRRNIKRLAIEYLGEFILEDRLEVIEGASALTIDWLISYLEKLIEPERRDIFSEALQISYDPNQTGLIAQYTYIEACEKLGKQIPSCDKVHFLFKKHANTKHRVIFQLQAEPGSCLSEMQRYDLSIFANSMSNAEYDCFVYLVHDSHENRMDDVPTFHAFNNVLSIDLHTMSQKGLRHAWKWSESKRTWKRVEVNLIE